MRCESNSWLLQTKQGDNRRFLLCFAAVVLLFFIAGLLYLLRFERIDNLGAYSIPSGDRPSHLIWLRQLPRQQNLLP